MNNRFFASLAGLLVVFVLTVWAGGQHVFAQVPPDFNFEDTKPQAAVPFSHKLHVTDKKVQCPACHMNPKLFEMKKGVASPLMKMADLNEGKFCGECHNGKKAFGVKDPKDCAKCHVKK